MKEEEKKDFLELCQNLGDSLTVGKGLWGEGIFESFTCAANQQSAAQSKADWRLDIREQGENTQLSLFQLFPHGAKVPEVLEAQTKVRYGISVIKEKKLAEVVAYDLLDALPFSRLIVDALAPPNLSTSPVKE